MALLMLVGAGVIVDDVDVCVPVDPDVRWTSMASPILPRLFLGDAYVAGSFPVMEELEIGYVINAAIEIANFHEERLTYLNLNLDDRVDQQLSTEMVQRVNEFIERAHNEGSSVLVHCHLGVSRAASVVLAHLITVHRMELCDALELVRSQRPFANPNPGFMKQLREMRRMKTEL